MHNRVDTLWINRYYSNYYLLDSTFITTKSNTWA